MKINIQRNLKPEASMKHQVMADSFQIANMYAGETHA
jgi:hypothetical protein